MQLVPELKPLPSEAIFDKIAMSAFEGTPLDMALRDCRLEAFAIVGIAMEIGIEPTVRHGADLGYIPVLIRDARGSGHRDAAERSVASLEFAGDASLTDVETICAQFGRIQPPSLKRTVLSSVRCKLLDLTFLISKASIHEVKNANFGYTSCFENLKNSICDLVPILDLVHDPDLQVIDN
ncbi:MAG: isochorismatase family protein [Terriglobales bacterium]